MFDVEFRLEHSSSKPKIIEEIGDTVILRKNIEEQIIGNGLFYNYLEAKLTKEEYSKYKTYLEYLNLEKIRADVDYIALMSDIDLDEI